MGMQDPMGYSTHENWDSLDEADQGPQEPGDYTTRGAWADVVGTFAGVLLLAAGAFGALQGASAVANDDLYSQGSEYLYDFDMTVWGWIHVTIGLASIVVAVGILMRRSWGQVTGMIVAGLSMVANFAFLPHYPFWALVLIAINVLIVWALSTQLAHYR